MQVTPLDGAFGVELHDVDLRVHHYDVFLWTFVVGLGVDHYDVFLWTSVALRDGQLDCRHELIRDGGDRGLARHAVLLLPVRTARARP